MTAPQAQQIAFTFSGHETFILRSNWLKKAYDLLQIHPNLFFLEDAFVRLGVGKNMAQSIRFWGRVCGVFAQEGSSHRATDLGNRLFDDTTGWDPFLVTPTSRWLLHWQIVAGAEAPTSYFYTFNLLRGGEFSAEQLSQQISQYVAGRSPKLPSETTLQRDIDCMLRSYVRPNAAQLGSAIEDALYCPLHELELIQHLPGQSSYRLVSGMHADLPDELVAYAALHQAKRLGRPTINFNELAYGERSPGRIFRLNEDALLSRLWRIEAITAGQAVYTETAGIRQISWRNMNAMNLEDSLLEAAFAQERRYA